MDSPASYAAAWITLFNTVTKFFESVLVTDTDTDGLMIDRLTIVFGQSLQSSDLQFRFKRLNNRL